MSSAKNHHYIPQSYQLLFSPDGEKVFFFDKKDERIIGPARPRNFCSENFLYAFRGNLAASAGSATHIESPFLSTIDGRFIKSAKILLSDEKDKTGASLYHLATFFGFLACRQPIDILADEVTITTRLVDFILDNAKLSPDIEKKAKEMGVDIDDRDAFRDVAYSESYDLSLMQMLTKAKSVARCLHDQMGWLYLYSDGGEYILNDNPFTILNDGELSDMGIEEAIFVPVSKTLSVVLSRHIGKSDHKYVTKDFVSFVNNIIYNRANRWLIGSSKDVLEDCIKANT